MLSKIIVCICTDHNVTLFVYFYLVFYGIVRKLVTKLRGFYLLLNYDLKPELYPPKSIPERVTWTARSKGFVSRGGSSFLLVV